MNLIEALAEVISITKRPDKDWESVSNINKAITYFTLKADFYQDLVEASLEISPTSYGETIDLSLLTRFRKFKYVKPRARRYYLLPISPETLLTPSGIVQPNRYYVAGQTLTYTLSELNDYLEVGYYQYPEPLVVGSVENHWMLDIIPWAVIERSASQVFKSIGEDISARFYEASSNELFLAARRDFASGTSE